MGFGLRGREKWFDQIPQGVWKKKRGHENSVRIIVMFQASTPRATKQVLLQLLRKKNEQN